MKQMKMVEGALQMQRLAISSLIEIQRNEIEDIYTCLYSEEVSQDRKVLLEKDLPVMEENLQKLKAVEGYLEGALKTLMPC